MKHSPLEPVAFLRIIYTNGQEITKGYGSHAEAMMAMQWLVGNRKVEHVQAVGNG